MLETKYKINCCLDPKIKLCTNYLLSYVTYVLKGEGGGGRELRVYIGKWVMGYNELIILIHEGYSQESRLILKLGKQRLTVLLNILLVN